MVKVYNRKVDEVPDGAVSIERPGKWGNDFIVGVHGNRAQCIARFAAGLTPAMRAAIRAELAGRDLVCACAPLACHGDVLLAIATPYRWAQYAANGYECSSAGDQMFSPLYARMPDGRTIEAHYQCDVKGHNPGGENWRDYKGVPAIGAPTFDALWRSYLHLWRVWAKANPKKVKLLATNATDRVLTDRFCKGSPINQAHALSVILNELAFSR